ncbi:Uncharacterised protein [Vibrio cholerae]|nr:Uncharacterised protein [Vibrio cholerae]
MVILNPTFNYHLKTARLLLGIVLHHTPRMCRSDKVIEEIKLRRRRTIIINLCRTSTKPDTEQ